MQAGVGASPGYSAIDDRRALGAGLQEGVMGAHSYEVTQRGAGVDRSVDIAATTADALGSGIAAVIQGDAITAQGLYFVPPHSAVINEAIAVADATNPRVDRVILEVLDNTHDASGSNLIRTRVVTGTASSGATLDNLTGAAAVPSSALLLADVLVPATDATIDNTQIRDRRKWARGAYVAITDTTLHTITSATSTLVDSTNINPRIECSGAPIRVVFDGTLSTVASASIWQFDLFVDGVSQSLRSSWSVALANPVLGVHKEWRITPSAGSHKIGLGWNSDGSSTLSMLVSTSKVTTFTVEELLQQSTANNATTSG